MRNSKTQPRNFLRMVAVGAVVSLLTVGGVALASSEPNEVKQPSCASVSADATVATTSTDRGATLDIEGFAIIEIETGDEAIVDADVELEANVDAHVVTESSNEIRIDFHNGSQKVVFLAFHVDGELLLNTHHLIDSDLDAELDIDEDDSNDRTIVSINVSSESEAHLGSNKTKKSDREEMIDLDATVEVDGESSRDAIVGADVDAGVADDYDQIVDIDIEVAVGG